MVLKTKMGGINGEVRQSWEETRPPIHHGVVAFEKWAFESLPTTVANFTNFTLYIIYIYTIYIYIYIYIYIVIYLKHCTNYFIVFFKQKNAYTFVNI